MIERTCDDILSLFYIFLRLLSSSQVKSGKWHFTQLNVAISRETGMNSNAASRPMGTLYFSLRVGVCKSASWLCVVTVSFIETLDHKATTNQPTNQQTGATLRNVQQPRSTVARLPLPWAARWPSEPSCQLHGRANMKLLGPTRAPASVGAASVYHVTRQKRATQWMAHWESGTERRAPDGGVWLQAVHERLHR